MNVYQIVCAHLSLLVLRGGGGFYCVDSLSLPFYFLCYKLQKKFQTALRESKAGCKDRRTNPSKKKNLRKAILSSNFAK